MNNSKLTRCDFYDSNNNKTFIIQEYNVTKYEESNNNITINLKVGDGKAPNTYYHKYYEIKLENAKIIEASQQLVVGLIWIKPNVVTTDNRRKKIEDYKKALLETFLEYVDLYTDEKGIFYLILNGDCGEYFKFKADKVIVNGHK